MPRYFFHVREGDDVLVDDWGTELADDDAARREAGIAVADVAKDVAKRGERGEIAVEVHNEAHELVITAHLSFDVTASTAGEREASRAKPPFATPDVHDIRQSARHR